MKETQAIDYPSNVTASQIDDKSQIKNLLIKSKEELQAEVEAQQRQQLEMEQAQAVTKAGENIASNIPPKTVGETIQQMQQS